MTEERSSGAEGAEGAEEVEEASEPEAEPKGGLGRRWQIAIEVAGFVVLLAATCWIFYPHLQQTTLGGGDNREWYGEARERDTIGAIFDFRYYSGRHGPSAYYNPVQMLIWRALITSFNYHRQPQPYYITCLVIHLLNMLIVYLLTRRITGRRLAAFGATMAFTVFFPNYQTVGWVAATVTTGVSGFFVFATLYMFILFFKTEQKLFMALACIAYGLGLLTKEFAVFAVPIAGFYYITNERKRIFRPIKKDLVMLPLCLVTVPMAIIVLSRLGSSAIVNEWGGFNFGIHMVYRFLDLVSYLITAQPAGAIVKIVAVAVALLGLPFLLNSTRKDPVLAFLTLWLCIAIFVYSYSNFRNIYSLQRYLYMPSVPWFILFFHLATRSKRLWLKISLVVPLFLATVGYSLYTILERR